MPSKLTSASTRATGSTPRLSQGRSPDLGRADRGPALALIDAVYAIESVNASGADVASPVEVQVFWKHGELSGFATGT